MNQGIKFYKTYDVKKISECHQSIGPKTLTPNSRLDRWSGVHNAISDWMINDADDEVAVKVAEENFQYYDPLQRKIMSELFARFRALVPKPLPQVNIDFFRQEVSKDIDGEQKGMYTSFQYQFQDEDNTEYIKLKAGVSDVEDIDKAIVAETKLEGETFLTAQLINDDFDEIKEPENSNEIIENYFETIREFENNRKQATPGLHCYMCSRPSRCGQYPVVDGQEPKSNFRGILISKSNLMNLGTCERWTSWRAQYAIPKDIDKDSFEAELGQKFHTYSQRMLEKNEDIFGIKEIERLKEMLGNEEEKFAVQILKKYEELIQALDTEVENKNELEIKLSEYGLGFSIVRDGIVSNSKMELRDDKVAVTFMGQADLVGRYKGKGLVIELKTGQESNDDLTEAELYALGAKLLLKEDEVYVFHIYTNKDGGKLKKRKFGESEFESIIEKFEDKAQTVGNWNPNDSLSPSFNVGDWCNNCDYQTTCPEYR